MRGRAAHAVAPQSRFRSWPNSMTVTDSPKPAHRRRANTVQLQELVQVLRQVSEPSVAGIDERSGGRPPDRDAVKLWASVVCLASHRVVVLPTRAVQSWWAGATVTST